jgi:dishevelled associated activator of morphogenesis
MKAFNWTKIADTKIDGTIWESVTDDNVQVDAEKLAALFCAARPKPPGGDGDKKPEDDGKPKKKVTPTVLDFQRSNNINILVKRFKKTPEEMKKAISTCDPDVMVADNIRALLKVVPTQDELDQINEFPNPEELGGAEQFLMALGSVTRLEARLKALLIKDGFEKRSTAVEEQMNILEKTIEEVRDSSKLKDFLAFVLKIGNFMNGTGARGGAYGFKLQDLVKLGDTKSFDNKTTLLAYMIEYFEKSKPELIKLADDFPTIQEGSRESLNEVVKDCNQLEGDRNFAKNQLREDEVDDFSKTITAFLEEADSSLGNLTARKTSIEQKFKNLKKSFGEQPAVDTNDFFEGLVKFLALYGTTYETILRKRKSEADKEKRAAKQAEMAAKKGAAAPAAAGGDGKDLGAVDKVLLQAEQGTRVQRNKRPPGPGMPGMGPPGGMGGFDPALLRANLKKT